MTPDHAAPATWTAGRPPTEAEALAMIDATERATAELLSRDLSALVGLPVGEAVAAVEHMGLRAMVLEPTDRASAEFNTGRIKLYTEQGRVHRATPG